MQLEGARAELRSRPPYEAADLGVLLLRALHRPALGAWLGFVLPLQLCVVIACSSFGTSLSYLALWWLKPVYDRAWGLVLGRGLFGDASTLRTLYRELWRAGRRGLLSDLSWRRLDPARTLVAPVALLEGLTGKPAARRRRTLGEGTTNAVGLVLLACVTLELATLLGLEIAARLLLPEEAGWIAQDLWSLDANDWGSKLPLGAYILALGLVEPLFVAAGFGLYINRRTDIEGWDVELTFRRMARRLTPLASATKPAGAALALLLALSGLWPVGAAADELEPPLLESAAAEDDALRLPLPEVDGDAGAAAMARVLARPELQRTHVEEHWELRHQPSKDEAPPESSAGWLSVLAGWLARSFEVLLWVLAGLALVVAIYLILQRRQRSRSRVRSPEPPPPPAFEALHGIDAPQALLPTREVVPSALSLLAQGRHVAALSVLYVGTLAALVRQDHLDLPRQATEGQCLAVVRSAAIADERRALFVELTQLWQLSAYAHALPEAARLQQICTRFSACFGGAA